MTRGNQRETDRARAAKRNAGALPSKEKDGLTATQRKERSDCPVALVFFPSCQGVFLSTG
jgi:hypothetical protein